MPRCIRSSVLTKLVPPPEGNVSKNSLIRSKKFGVSPNTGSHSTRP